jgi:hypothetical protein
MTGSFIRGWLGTSVRLLDVAVSIPAPSIELRALRLWGRRSMRPCGPSSMRHCFCQTEDVLGHVSLAFLSAAAA